MKVKVKKMVPQEVEIDVVFPFYRKYETSTMISFYKINSDLKELQVCFYKDEKFTEITIDSEYILDGDFNSNENNSNEIEFNEALQKALNMVLLLSN